MIIFISIPIGLKIAYVKGVKDAEKLFREWSENELADQEFKARSTKKPKIKLV